MMLISDIHDMEIAVFSNDMSTISNYLSAASNVSYLPKNNILEIETAIKNDEASYAFVPYNLHIDFILENGFIKY